VELEGYEWEEWWVNDDASVHRLTRPGSETLFVKEGLDLSAEYERFEWCQGRLPVPEVVAFDRGPNDRLITRALPGAGAHDRETEPDTAVVAAVLAEALQLIHALPINDCPFVAYTSNDWLDSITRTLVRSAEVWDEDLAVMRPAGEVLDELIETRPVTRELTVVHGDASTPNFVMSNGRLTGIVDVAGLGIGDPWGDLAVCLASMRRPGNGLAHEQRRFLANYGAAEDPARERWHRLLYRLGDAA
jgi:aminoglycoside phosphotransferase